MGPNKHPSLAEIQKTLGASEVEARLMESIPNEELEAMKAALDEVLERRELLPSEADLYESIVYERKRRHKRSCELLSMCDDLRDLILQIQDHMEVGSVDKWFQDVLQPLVDDTLPMLQKLK